MANKLSDLAADLDSESDRLRQSLSNETREHLRAERMLSDEVINYFSLGAQDKRVSIPIRGSDGKVKDIRLYLPKPYRSGKKIPKILSFQGGDGTSKLFPIEVVQLFKLKQQRISGGALDAEILENLDRLEILERLLGDFDTLLLVEGEMDALAAISQGLPAITNTCGAGTWDESFSQILSEMKMPMAILLDADESGLHGTQLRATSLDEYDVKTYTVEWPSDSHEGHDVTDELKANGLSGLMKVVGSAKRFRDVVSLDEIVAEDVDWLFSPYIAIKKVTLIEGDPGIGKTFFTLAIAAAVTVGGRGLPGDQSFDPENVLLMTAEDGLEDTIKKRLDQMDADLSKILAPKENFTLDDKGFETLGKLIKRYHPKLVIIDPMTPFLGSGADTNKATDMRPFFRRLYQLAQRHGCAVVVTRHLAKNREQTGVSRGLGSIDISAAVRSIIQVSEDKDDKNLKRAEHIKSNIGLKGKPLGYRLDGGVFSWVGTLENTEREDEEEKGELERACDFLTESLRDGPIDALEMTKQALSAGFSKSTLNRAKRRVKIKSKRGTEAGKTICWKWYLPHWRERPDLDTQGSQDDQDPQESFPGMDDALTQEVK